MRVATFDSPKTILIGRAADAHLALPDDSGVSKYHCRMELNPPECFVHDLGSRTGTFVNGHRIQTAFLEDGDRVNVGATELTIRVVHLARTVTCDPPTPLLTRPVGEQTVESDASGPIGLGPVRSESYWSNPPQPSEPWSMQEVPGFETVREIGRGGMGAVFEAYRKGTGEHIALKIITPMQQDGEKALQLFLREASVLSQLEHKRIVKFHEVGIANSQLFIAMEYVDTIDLRQHVADRAQSEQIRYYCGVVCQVLEALVYAHGRGLVHRDVKPSNILVSLSNGHLRSKLTDFGLAKSFENAGNSGITRSGEVRGTISFMAPEQLMDSRYAKPAADMYSVGATLYYFLSGEYPYQFSDSRTSLKAVLEGAIVPLETRIPDVLPELAAVVRKAMAKDPAQRFGSAREMYRALYPLAREPAM